MFRSLGGTEIVLILAVVLLLFGAKRLPDAARGLGRSLRIFKSEVSAMGDDAPAKDGAPVTNASQESASAPTKPAPADSPDTDR